MLANQLRQWLALWTVRNSLLSSSCLSIAYLPGIRQSPSSPVRFQPDKHQTAAVE